MIARESQNCAWQEKLNQSETSINLDASGLVTSSQAGVHPQLEKALRRHLDSVWSQPFHKPTVNVYPRLVEQGVFSSGQPIILDSGCGTGKSTRHLANLFPGHLVIGVDQSSFRLAKSGVTTSFHRQGNCVLMRAELSTFWRLLLRDGLNPVRHFLFYPNPWPKTGHLTRRWHGHPVFPDLLSLGGEIEMRCNWEIYALEFAQAVNYATGLNVKAGRINPERGITPFERKYLERGQSLFCVNVPATDTNAFRLSRVIKP
jgi:tRNA (guanine-N7-)-methyltransferase